MMHTVGKCYAIIPAAGRSRRMGRSKLMLPWPTVERPDGTLMDRVLEVWTGSRASKVVVVVRRDDEPLAEVCRDWPVTLVQPEVAPTDMKGSVVCGVKFLNRHEQPGNGDRCFVAPADLPTLASRVIDQMIATKADSDRMVVPTFGDRLGHPVLLPWAITAAIDGLGKDEGIDQLVSRYPQTIVSFGAEDAVNDIDTPAEYEEAIQAARRR